MSAHGTGRPLMPRNPELTRAMQTASDSSLICAKPNYRRVGTRSDVRRINYGGSAKRKVTITLAKHS